MTHELSGLRNRDSPLAPILDPTCDIAHMAGSGNGACQLWHPPGGVLCVMRRFLFRLCTSLSLHSRYRLKVPILGRSTVEFPV